MPCLCYVPASSTIRFSSRVGHLKYSSCAGRLNVVDPILGKPDAPTREHVLDGFEPDQELDVSSFATQLPAELFCPVLHWSKANSDARFLSSRL